LQAKELINQSTIKKLKPIKLSIMFYKKGIKNRTSEENKLRLLRAISKKDYNEFKSLTSDKLFLKTVTSNITKFIKTGICVIYYPVNMWRLPLLFLKPILKPGFYTMHKPTSGTGYENFVNEELVNVSSFKACVGFELRLD
jgi:hypothetical protein